MNHLYHFVTNQTYLFKIDMIGTVYILNNIINVIKPIIVMTRRPAKVKKIYDIKLTNASTPINNRKCKEFSIYYDQIWRDLDVHL